MNSWKIGAAQLEISENQIRSYSIRNVEGALTVDQLKIVCMDYLNKVLRKLPKFDKWPKDIKDLCASKGIIQNKENGLPIYNKDIESAWCLRAKHAELKNVDLQRRIMILEESEEARILKLKQDVVKQATQ